MSVKVPMLETEACVTESEAGLIETAEPAAASERDQKKRQQNTECVPSQMPQRLSTMQSFVNGHLPSTDCIACIELKPFCKTNNEGKLTGYYGNRLLITS